MNLSDTSSVVTLLLGAITALAWLRNLLSWFRRKHADAQNIADEGNRLAQMLLKHATNPAKRADIYLLLTLRAVDANARQTQATVHAIAGGFAISVLVWLFLILNKLFVIHYFHPISILAAISLLFFVAAFCMALWFSFNVRRIDERWHAGAIGAIQQKVNDHTV